MSTKQAIYNYDPSGRLKEVTFSNGGKITYQYDSMGNRKSVVEVPLTGCCDLDPALGNVYYGDGTDVVALTPGTDGQVFTTHGASAAPTWEDVPAGAGGLVWRGAWSSATAYVINDAVSINGATYIAVANNTNSQPPSANWNTLAAKGDTGATGSTGATGAQGPTGPQGPAGADGTSAVKAGFKASTTSRTSTTTLADDPDLVLNVDANKSYHFTGFLCANGGGGEFKMTFVGPSGATLAWKVNGIDNSNFSGLLTGGQTTVLDITGGERGFYFSGMIVVSSTAVILKLQWAQASSSANASNLMSGSSLTLIQM